MKLVKKIFWLILVFTFTLLIPQLSYYITRVFIPELNQDEPVKQFIFMLIHHCIQLILSIILLKSWFKNNLSQMGFNLNKKALSLKILKWFLAIWFITVVIFYLISLRLFQGFGDYITSYFPTDYRFAIKDFAFEIFLPGIGEEPLFRAFVVLALIKYWDGSFQIGKLNIPYVALISGFFFMIGHINYSIYPFAITHCDTLQLTTTFVLGVFWATIFVKTKSLLCPILAHNGANIIQYIVGYLASFFLIK